MDSETIHSPGSLSDENISYLVYSQHPLFKLIESSSPVESGYSSARSQSPSGLHLIESQLQPEGIFKMANISRYVANSFSRMLRSVNADSPKYLVDASPLSSSSKSTSATLLTADQLVARTISELESDPQFISFASDIKTIEADDELDTILKKMAKLHEAVARKVARIMLNDEAIKDIEKKIKKRERNSVSPKKSYTKTSPTKSGKKRTFDEYEDESDSYGFSKGSENEMEIEEVEGEIIDVDEYEISQANIKNLIDEFKMDIEVREQKIAMNEARIGLIQRELARRARGGEVVENWLDADIELEEPKKIRRERKAEKTSRKKVRTHWQKPQQHIKPKPKEETQKFRREEVAMGTHDIMEVR